MRFITMTVSIQFDADRVTHGTKEEQAAQAVEQINGALGTDPEMCAQIMGEPTDITEETEEEE